MLSPTGNDLQKNRRSRLRSKYFHLAMRRGRKIAKVAMARRLAIALYWMWRKGWNYEQLRKFGSHAGQLGTGDGVL
jgi:transposase